MSLNLYKIYQEKNKNWNTYVSAVVCAESEEKARFIHPDVTQKGEWWIDKDNYDDWVKPQHVKVIHIGTTDSLQSGEVICSSNTGA